MSTVSEQQNTYNSEQSRILSEARSILGEHDLARHQELHDLLRDGPGDEVFEYVFQTGIKRWRACKTTAWSRRFEHVYTVFEERGHAVAIELILERASSHRDLQDRLDALFKRRRQQDQPLEGRIWNIVLAIEDTSRRQIALGAVDALLSPGHIEGYITRWGVDARLLDLIHNRDLYSPRIIDAALPALLDRLGVDNDLDKEVTTILDAIIARRPGAHDQLERCVKAYDQNHYGELDERLDYSERAWLAVRFDRPYPEYPSQRTATPNNDDEHLTPVEVLANRLREVDTAARHEVFFGELELDTHALPSSTWERIANAIDHAPTHNERLRLTSLLLKAADKPQTYPRLDRLTKHWCEHGSNGATRRAGHKGSKRSRRGASQRHTARTSARATREPWRETYGYWGYARAFHTSVTRYDPTAYDTHGTVVAYDADLEFIIDELEAIDDKPIDRLQLHNFTSYPHALQTLLSHPRLRDLKSLTIATEIDSNTRVSIISGNMAWTSYRATNRFYHVIEDAWLARMVEAIMASPAAHTLEALILGDGHIGPRTFQSLTRLLAEHQIYTLGLSCTHIDDTAFIKFAQEANLINLARLWTDTGNFRDGYEEYNHCERYAAFLPEHLRPETVIMD